MPAYALSFAGAILIYMSLFIYGAQVMRGVIEEKTSRIIEVIVSSVKPFQLMAGKIMAWAWLDSPNLLCGSDYLASDKLFSGHNASSQQSALFTLLYITLASNAGYELGCFIFYWLTGFLFYSALFAAVGSAVDSETETQQFMFPITLPLLFTYILCVILPFSRRPTALWLFGFHYTVYCTGAMMVRCHLMYPAGNWLYLWF